MKHPLPWRIERFEWIVLDADGKTVCEASGSETAKEIVAVSKLAHATLEEIKKQEINHA